MLLDISYFRQQQNCLRKIWFHDCEKKMAYVSTKRLLEKVKKKKKKKKTMKAFTIFDGFWGQN